MTQLKNRSRNSYKSEGFTLLETLIVLTLMGVMLTILLPDFGRILDDSKLNTAAVELSQNIRMVQQKAVSDNGKNIYKIVFDLNRKDRYQIHQGFIVKIIYLPSGITFEWTNFSKKQLIFYASGAPEEGGTVAIKNKNKMLYVIVRPATGFVRIDDSYSPK